jgi:hypothetical protein
MARNTGRQKPKVQRPSRVEIQIFSEINLPAMSDGQKLYNLFVDSDNGILKFLQKNDVAVYVAEHGRFAHFFSALHEVIKQGGAKFVSVNVPEIANLQFGGDLCRALLFTEKKNFRTRIKFGPTGDGVALNYANMPYLRLGTYLEGALQMG